MTDNEEWRKIPRFDGKYSASSLGRVRNDETGTVRKASPDQDGYLRSCFYHNGKNNTVRIHKLVAEAFLGDGNGLFVNHKDGDKTNNCPENLEYVTNRCNATHALRKGLTGACFNKRKKKWLSSIYVSGKSKGLGYFDTEKEASDRYFEELKKQGLENQYARN